METNIDNTSVKAAPTKSPRGKYITLVFLLVWVAAVIVFTFLKFSGGGGR